MGRKRSSGSLPTRLSGLGLAILIAVAALAALVGSSAAPAAPPKAVPVRGFHLGATLLPVGKATGSGEFSALLMQTGPPAMKPPALARQSLRWSLVWRLTYSGLAGRVAGVIETIPHVVGMPPATATTLCKSCSSTQRGQLTLTPALASALLRNRTYIKVSSADEQLRGRISIVPPGTPMLLSFGQTGGNIRPFTVTVTSDGRLHFSGPGWRGRGTKIVPLPVRQGLLRLAQAEGFFSMPTLTRCSGTLPDVASRFIKVSTGSEVRTVVVHGSCNRSFDETYAVFSAAILGASPTG